MNYIEVLTLYLFILAIVVIFIGTYQERKREIKKTKLLVFPTDQVVCCDVDDTLVMWPENQKKSYPYDGPNLSHTQPYEGAVAFKDPYDNSTNYLIPHQKHIDLLKKYRGRGFTIILWSAGGYKWAESVAKTLGLEPYIDIVLTKPSRYVDDLPSEKWMGNRVYLK